MRSVVTVGPTHGPTSGVGSRGWITLSLAVTGDVRSYTTLWNLDDSVIYTVLQENWITKLMAVTRFSHWKLLWRNTHLMMPALCNSLTSRYLPSNSQNNWLHAAAATKKKKTPQQKPFAHHQRWFTFSDVVSWQVKICLHQFDNYLSRVKVNVKTVNNSHTQDIWRVLSLSVGQCHRVRETISFLACNLAKCWLVINFYKHTQHEFAVNFSWKCHNTSNTYLQWFMTYR